jgi:hypothetical protein
MGTSALGIPFPRRVRIPVVVEAAHIMIEAVSAWGTKVASASAQVRIRSLMVSRIPRPLEVQPIREAVPVCIAVEAAHARAFRVASCPCVGFCIRIAKHLPASVMVVSVRSCLA